MLITENRRALNFSTDIVDAFVIEDVQDFFVEDGIVLNLDAEPVAVGVDEPLAQILPWKSAKLFHATVKSARRLAVFRTAPQADLKILGKGTWDWFGDRLASFPRTTQLYISPVDRVGTADVNLTAFTGRNFQALGTGRYEIRLNFWFAPAGTDCGLHNTHDFLEIHTQIAGTGRIEKFTANDGTTKFEEMVLPEGATHQFFGDLAPDASPFYPWHRYIAVTDCVWLAIEFHPIA